MFLPRILLAVLLCLFSVCLFASPAFAAAPPGETWFTLKTPHFRLHHPLELEAYARKFGASLERALPILTKDLRWTLATPVDVILMDTSDSANGFAASFPNTRIEAYAVPFDSSSPLSYYYDWADELALHELTHLIANDATHGFYKPLRWLFGSWVKPNGLQPTWLIEGLAVYTETEHTPGGRGRSPMLESILRAAVLEKKLNSPDYISIDRFNDGVPWWPGGNTAYLMGYVIHAAAVKDTKKKSAPGDLSFANAARIPFMPNTNAEAVTGKNWHQLWADAAAHLQNRYLSTNVDIAGYGASMPGAPCRLTKSGRFTGGHALSPDGWIYFSEEDWNEGWHLSRVRGDAPCGQAVVERLAFRRGESPSQVAVSPEGKLVAFAKADSYTADQFLSDIYLYDVDARKEIRVTNGARAFDPAFGENATTLYFTRNNKKLAMEIIERNLDSSKERIVYTSAPLARVSGLSHASRNLLFSLHLSDGRERIMELDPASGAVTPATSDRKGSYFERNPFRAADGTLYYAASYDRQTQVIHAASPSRGQGIVAESGYGFLDRPVRAPDGTLFATEYGTNGMDIVRISPESIRARAQAEPLSLHAYLMGEGDKGGDSAPPAGSGEAFAKPESYSAFSSPATSMWPQYWLPEFFFAEEGAIAGASTSGNDALEYHRYGGSLQWDSRADFPLYLAYYRNRQHSTNFHFQAEQTNNYLFSSATSNRNAVYSAEAILPFANLAFSFGTAFQEKRLFGRKSQSFFFFQNASYSDVGKKPAAIDANYGKTFAAYLGLFPSARSETFFADFRPRAAIFFEGVRPSHSVAFSANAGITTNRFLASNYYLGGGVSTLSPSDYVVRGYPVDALLGQRIATANFSYTLPIAHPFRGWSTNPLFLRSYGLKFHADVGSANFISQYTAGRFRGYLPMSLGREVLFGSGIDLVGTGSMLYHVPINLALGLHYGPQKRNGGDLILFFGLGIGAYGNLGDRKSDASL